MQRGAAVHQVVELRCAVVTKVDNLAVQNGIVHPQRSIAAVRSGKDLNLFPLGDSNRAAPLSTWASARKPSYFTS